MKVSLARGYLQGQIAASSGLSKHWSSVKSGAILSVDNANFLCFRSSGCHLLSSTNRDHPTAIEAPVWSETNFLFTHWVWLFKIKPRDWCKCQLKGLLDNLIPIQDTVT